jgi:hypothetical protein
MASVDYSFGSTASGFGGRGGRGGGGGGGKKPPPGGQGARLPVSPTKTREPSPVQRVMEASKPVPFRLLGLYPANSFSVASLLHRPLSAALAHEIAGILGDLLQDGVILPQFLIDIGRAHAAGDNASDDDSPFVIDGSDGPDEDAPTLFHFLYRRGRPHIRNNFDPSRLTRQRQFAEYHNLAVTYGVKSGGTVGPNGTLLAALLLRYAAGAIHFFQRRDINASDCACNNCTSNDAWCTQFEGPHRRLLLLGRCLACWMANRSNCSFRKFCDSLGRVVADFLVFRTRSCGRCWSSHAGSVFQGFQL